MVVQGGFLLQLIDAETQQPLNEYCGPSGAVYYAEATIGGEYFLRFQVLREDEEDVAEGTIVDDKDEKEMLYFRPSVDGKDLGFYTNLTNADGARDVGLWTYVNGIGINRALKFETAATNIKLSSNTDAAVAVTAAPSTVSEEESSATDISTPSKTSPPRLHMGNVQVQISKAVFTGHQKRVYSSIPSLTQEETVVAEQATASISASSSLHEEEDEAGDANGANAASEKAADSTTLEGMMDPVAVLRSREGEARFEQEFTEECPTYKPGELLETITIHYGSMAALVQAGVLLPVGAVPLYVGVSPDGSGLEKTEVPTPEGKSLPTSPLLDVSSSNQPTGSKRLHSSAASGECSNEDGAKTPVMKKPCREMDATDLEPLSTTVVSGK